MKMEDCWWSAEQLRNAINRCEQDCVDLVNANAKPETIECRRHGIEVLYRLLRNAERRELEAVKES